MARATSIAAVAVGGAALVHGKPKTAARWEPARHKKDAWLDVPSKHRLVFDTTTVNGMAEAIAFANNFMNVNRTGYGLQNSDLALLIIARHRSTPFAYNDAMWEKYGAAMTPLIEFNDPKTKVPPSRTSSAPRTTATCCLIAA